MYRITVEEEKNGVYERMEDACLETTGYVMMAERNKKRGANYQIMNLSSMDLMNMLLNNATLVEVITLALPVLPLAIKKAAEETGESAETLPPEIDAEELLNSLPHADSGSGGAKPESARRSGFKGILGKLRGKGRG